MDYIVTGTYPFLADQAAQEKMKTFCRRHPRFLDGSLKGTTLYMPALSNWFREQAAEGGQIYSDAANFWELRYHFLKGDMDAFLSGKPGFRTLLHPDLTGRFRGSTLAFAGIRHWVDDTPLNTSKTEGGLFIVNKLPESCSELADGAKSEPVFCDRCLTPLMHYQTFLSTHEGYDLAEAEAWLQTHPFLDLSVFEQRIGYLPVMMHTLFRMIMGYLHYNVPLELFADTWLDSAAPVYKRIEAGPDREEFTENYQVEIELLRAVSKACDAFTRCCEGVHEMIVKACKTYLTTETKIRKQFLI